MKLFLDTETGVLSLASGGTALVRLDVKQRDLMRLEVFPSASLPQGTSGLFAAKETFSGAVMALDTAWVAPVQSGAGYVFEVNLNTVELDALFTAEVSAVKLRAEIRWETPDGAVRRAMTFDLIVNRAVYLGNESVPQDAMPPYPLPGEIVTEAGLMYEIESEGFSALAQRHYAVDTSAASVTVTLPAAPDVGDVIYFVDAKGTWETHAVTIARNGKKIEGDDINFVNSSSGTSFFLVYIDATTGWKIALSGARPMLLTAPILTDGGSSISATNGTWTGSPTSYTYQWQRSDDGVAWADISGATAATYTTNYSTDNGKYVRIIVVAANSNGSSQPAYSASEGPLVLTAFPSSGLLAFWKLADLTDASGNGNTLTNVNAVGFVVGKIGDAAEFDGSNYLSAGSSGNWMLPQPSTVNFWVYRDGSQASELMGNRVTEVYCSWGLCLDSDNKLRLLSYDSGSWASSSGGAYGSVVIPNATWVMVTIISDADTLTVLIDTEPDEDMSDISHTGFSGLSYKQLYIGKGGDGGFSGKIDAVGVWNRVLTLAEVQTLYNSGGGLEP